MVRFRDWDAMVGPLVDGAPVPSIVDAVRQACIEFCQKTRIDTAIITRQTWSTAEPDFFIPSPHQAKVAAEAITVWIEGLDEPLPSRTRPEIDALLGARFPVATVGSVDELFGWISLRPDKVRLVPMLDADLVEGLHLEVCFQPKNLAESCEDFLYNLYGETIAFGAAARLHSHVNAPYAKPDRFDFFDAEFKARTGAVADKARGGHNKVRLAVGSDLL